MIKRRPTKAEIERVLNCKLGLFVTKDSERILIGTESEIKRGLEGYQDADLVYDETRPFGTLLLSLDQDADGDWGTAVFRLMEAQELMHTPKWKRLRSNANAPELEAIAQNILQEKFDSGDPICQFVSARIWYGYWLFREEASPENCRYYLNSMHNLIRPFFYPYSYLEEYVRIVSNNSIFRHAQEFSPNDREKVIYHIGNMAGAECIIVDKSLIPLEKYYSDRLAKWKKFIVRCKICNTAFMADTLRYELCSDECRNQARLNNLALRKQDENTSDVDRMVRSSAAHWYNRLKKMKESEEWSLEDIEKYVSAKNRFLKERCQKRKAYKKSEITFKDLQDWLFAQERLAQEMMDAIRLQKGDNSSKEQ